LYLRKKFLAVTKSDSENGYLIGFSSYEMLGIIEKYITLYYRFELHQQRQF